MKGENIMGITIGEFLVIVISIIKKLMEYFGAKNEGDSEETTEQA